MSDGTSIPRVLLDIRTFGLKYGPSRSTTYKLITSGELTAVKVGRRTFIAQSAADEWSAGLITFKPRGAANA